MNYEIKIQDVDELERLANEQNEERGISCVKDIVGLLRMGNFEMARRIRQWDGDKTRGYKEVEAKLYDIFGCRSHGIKGCTSILCK